MHGAKLEQLTLVQRRGTATKTLACFTAQAAALTHNVKAHSKETSVVLAALNAAIERRQPAWLTQGQTGERERKRQRTSEGRRKEVVFAAQLVQSVVKVYAAMDVGTATAEDKDDLVAALDLACVALYVVCALAHVVRLGDLVVENLLYQVAKKYAEIPNMRKVASCIATCVHVRLWNEHTKLCGESSEIDAATSNLIAHLRDEVKIDFAAVVAKKLALVAEFPRPTSFHTVHYARLLLGHTSLCVTLLAAAENYGAVRLVAETTLSPWIDYVRALSDQNSKLASSFSDRTFRLLWKCAAAVDSGDQNASKANSAALLFRSTALTFVLRCSNYLSLYFIQQVFRVGVQHERSSKRSHQGLEDVCAFYDRSENALLRTCPNSSQSYKSESFEWEYIQWLEHFASICESLGMHLKSATILEAAVNYARMYGNTEAIQSCLLFSIAGALLRASGDEKRDDDIQSEAGSSRATFDKRLGSEADRTIRELVHSTSSDKLVARYEKASSAYLGKFEVFVASSFESLRLPCFSVYAPFVMRCLKRSSISMYNYGISAQHSTSDQLRHQVVTSFGVMCKVIKELRETFDETDSGVIEALIVEELRLHRMAVVLIVRCCVADARSSTPSESALHAISCHVDLIRELLHNAMMGTKPGELILQRVLGDLKSVARDCYSFATQYYKTGNYQETISLLTEVFQLAEKYVQCLMRNSTTADEMHTAHAQLKLDDIASLLAHCYREQGDVVRSRQFAEYSLMYCADIHQKIPQASVSKYVLCVLDELKKSVDGAIEFIVSAFKAFLNTIARVFKSRYISDDRIVLLWIAFRHAFECASAKTMDSALAEDCVEIARSDGVSAESRVRLCGMLQSCLDDQFMKLRLKVTEGESFHDILLDVSQCLARRKYVYCSCYIKRDFNAAVEALLLVHHSLTVAVKKLQFVAGAPSVDIGGVYGWRGVIAMEITVIASYAGLSANDVTRENIIISENGAIADIEQCLKYWDGRYTSGILFDAPYMICCLQSICNTLSITSCSPLEEVARKLLKTLQCLAGDIITPVPWLLGSAGSVNRSVLESDVAALEDVGINSELRLFELVDKALLAAEISRADDNKGQTCQHLHDAMATLGDIKPSQRQYQTALFAKAVRMREYVAHVILSDLYFHEGRSKCAIAEAKAALRICWKMAKKCTALSSSTECPAGFELPSELTPVKSQQRKSGYLLNFMALESSSWDVLLAAKMILCRIASLYALCDQPRRATVYLTEAMRLVSGLNLGFFRRSPFYEYAELELNASHLETAKVAISLLSCRQKREAYGVEGDRADCAMASWHHSYIESDLAFLEQRCMEIVQWGDVYQNEGDYPQALACFVRAIEALDTVGNQEHIDSKRLSRAKVRCWRKYTRLQSQICDFSDSAAIEALLISMKRLKQSIEACDTHLERVKCLLELGRINLRLLRSASHRAFTSLSQTIAFLEEAYLLGDRLCIAHLNQELRTALGMTYFAEIEDNTGSKDDSVADNNRVRFISWMSCALLANAGSTGMVAVKEASSVELGNDASSRDSLMVQLEHLATSSAARHELKSHKYLTNMAKSINKQVEQLPDNWIIVSVTISLSHELMITRLPTNGHTPVSFRLPGVVWVTFIREVDAIIQDSREVLSGHTAEEASSWNTKQKENWWRARELLDKRIDNALVSMQETLGFWRCLLVGGPSTPERIERCWDLLVARKQGSVRLAERNQTLLCAIANSLQCLSDREVIDGLKHIAAEMGAPISDSTAHEALSVLRSEQNDTRSSLSTATLSNSAKLSTGRLARMKVGEMRQLLAAEGLSTDGSKKAMIERLNAVRAAAFSSDHRLPTKPSANRFCAILILHHELQQFPWEGMDVMGLSSGVTRMPSLDLIVQNAKCSRFVRRDRVQFLLNPAGDLRSTQHQLGPILAEGTTAYGWGGTVGEVPDPDELRNTLAASDLFIYCGHGSGEAYLPRDKVLGLQPDCSAALLFGCSSGRLEREGIFGPHGAVLAYLRAGSPAVLAMLWDVTDRDIDKLSVKILQDWLLANSEDRDGLSHRRPSLAEVLQDSRSVCKLKYLNGHAAICYGLPLYVASH